jgi:hypothetical protein
MKRTVIKYVSFGNMVTIKEIENAASKTELIDEFGADVALAYADRIGRSRYMRIEHGVVQVYDNHRAYYEINPGKIIYKEQFASIIAAMKDAGNRLQRIKNMISTKEVKQIII